MPVLESPEVICTHSTSGLSSFHQKVNTKIAPSDYETDVGLNGPAGLNVVCHSIQVYYPPVSGDYSNAISMSLYLSEDWAQKYDFMTTMEQDHSVKVTEEQMPWGSTLTKIQVTGQNNIHIFGKHLRQSFAETVHDGATIQRQIVNPALLGTAMDHMNDVVAKSQQPQPSLGHTWATYDWNA